MNLNTKILRVAVLSALALVAMPTAIADDGWSVHQAIIDNDADRLRDLLIKVPRNVNVSGFGTGTPLHLAIASDNADVVEILLKAGADVDSIGKATGDAPLHVAAQKGGGKFVDVLLARGANVNILDEEGATPLFAAIRGKHSAVLTQLLAAGANANHSDKFGQSALLQAVRSQSTYNVDALLDAGAELNVREIAEKLCAGCHVRNEEILTTPEPYLEGLTASYFRKQIADYQSGDRLNTYMTRFSLGLSSRVIFALAEHYEAQPVGTDDADEAKAATGAKIWQQGLSSRSIPACSSCHGSRGQGDEQHRIPRLFGQKQTYVQRALKNFRSGDRTNDPDAVMRAIAKTLGDAEIEGLAAFVASRTN